MYDAARQIAQTDQQLLMLVDHPVAALDHRGRIVFHNDAFADAIQNSALRAPGQSIHRLLSDTENSLCTDYFSHPRDHSAAAKDRFIAPIDIGGVRRQLSIVPFSAAASSALYLCQLQYVPGQSDVRLDYLMEHLDQGIWDYDVRAGHFQVSKAWREMRGLGPDRKLTELEQDWLSDVHPDDRSHLRDILEGQRCGNTSAIK